MLKKGTGILSVIAMGTDIVFMSSICTLFGFVQTGKIVGIQILPWLSAGWTGLIINRTLMQKARPALLYVYVNAIYYAVQCAVLFSFFAACSGIWQYMVAGGFLLFSTGRGYSLCRTEVTQSQGIVYAEFSILLAALFLALAPAIGLPLDYCLPPVAAVLTNIFSLIWLRITGEKNQTAGLSKPAGFAILSVILGAIAVLTVFYAKYVSGPLGGGLVSAWGGLLLGIRAVLSWIGGGIGWFLSLFPMPEGGPIEMEPGETLIPSGEVTLDAEISQAFLWVVAGASMIGIIIFLVLLFRYIKKLRLDAKPETVPPTERVKKNRQAVLRKIRERIQALWLRVCFFAKMLACRNEPEGVFAFLVGYGTKRSVARRPGETARKYVVRLAASCPGLALMRDEGTLERLCVMLDQRYFSCGAEHLLSQEELKKLRRSVFVRAK